MLIALLVLVGFILLMLASGAYIFCVACCRGKRINWLDDEALAKGPYRPYYSQIVAGDRWLKAHGAQDLFINAKDGIRLHSLWVSAPNAKGTVMLFHGYRSSYLVDFSLAFSFYHDAGFNLFIPDQRAHGESEGRFITFGVKESQDLLSWVSFHNRTFGDIPIILSGLSMGASTVLFSADEPLPRNVRGIIADCGFTSPKEILAVVYRKTTHLPAFLSMWTVDIYARLFAGFSITQKNTRQSLANCNIPILMIHGREDTFVPCKMSEDGYNACCGMKTLFLVDGADHGVSFICDRAGYTEKVDRFLGENIDNFQPGR